MSKPKQPQLDAEPQPESELSDTELEAVSGGRKADGKVKSYAVSNFVLDLDGTTGGYLDKIS